MVKDKERDIYAKTTAKNKKLKGKKG